MQLPMMPGPTTALRILALLFVLGAIVPMALALAR